MTSPSINLTPAERIFGHVRTGPLRLASWAASYVLGSVVYYSNKYFGRDLLPPRNSLPEPLDIGDHYGNIPDSIAVGGLSSLIACGFLRLASTPDRVKRVALTAAISMGALANLASETVIGQKIFDFQDIVASPNYTPNQDVIDFTIGTTIVKTQNHDFIKEAFDKHSQQPANTEPLTISS